MTRILKKDEIARLTDMKGVIDAVETVYRLKAKGETVVWPLVSHDFEEQKAVMDIRSGYVKGMELHGLKMLNNFPGNIPQGLPPFNGLLMVFDSYTGLPLGVMDAALVTCMRTGAAGALGAKCLAREDSETLLLLGAGRQAPFQIAATLILMPQIKKVYLADPLNLENAKSAAAGMKQQMEQVFGLQNVDGVEFLAAENLAEAVGESDIIITVTPAREPVIKKEWVKAGTHFSCVGADMEGKEEIAPQLFAEARIFADDKAQCMRVGEMEIPLKSGIIKESDIAGELGQLLSGEVSGRQNAAQITIYDATGLALLDLATARVVLTAAAEKGVGIELEL